MNVIRSRLMTAFIAVSLASGVARVTSAQTYDLVTAAQQAQAAQQAVTALQGTVSGHTTQLSTLQGSVTNNSAAITALQNSIAALQTGNGGSGTGSTTIAPVQTVAPLIAGTATVGQTLTVSAGTFVPTASSETYQWKRNGTAISGATNPTYTLVSADAGNAITVAVTATNQYGSTIVTTASTPTVAANGSQVTAPVNTVLPLISGTDTVGSVLTVSNGTWTQSPTSYAIQFYRTAATQGATPAAISGATASTYTLASADVGDTITATVVASNTAGSSSPATSLPTPVIAASGTITPTPTESYLQAEIAAYQAVAVVTAQPTPVTTPSVLTGNTGTQAELAYLQSQITNLASVLVVTAQPSLPTAPTGDTAIGSLTEQNYLQAEITALQAVAVTTAAVPASTPPGGTAVPGQVTGVVVTAGIGSLTVNALSVTATPPVTGYTIEVNGSAMAGATNVTLPYTITGLTVGTTYVITVAAVNQIGTGTYSNSVSGTPINQAASPNGTLVTALNTPLYDGNGHTATLVTGTTGKGVQIALEGTIDATTSQVVELYENNGNLYQLNSGGAWYTEPWTGGPGVYQPNSPIVATTVPTQVAGLTVTPGPSSLTINATQNPGSQSVTGYTIKLGTSVVATNVALPYTAGNLTAGTAVSVTVAAVNAAGTGPYSTAVSGTPTTGTTFTAQTSSLPAVLYQIDAAEPVVATAVSGTPGIQLDSTNGGVAAAEETGSGVLLTHGYGETAYLPSGGPNGAPYFHDVNTDYNTGFDGLVWPNGSGNLMFQPTGATFFMKFVMRQVSGTGNNNLFVYRSAGGQVDVQPTGTNGGIYVDQNNTSINGTESSAPAVPTAWEIIDVVGNSAGAYQVYRNGTVVLTTATSNAIGGLPPTTAMEILNNCGCDLAFAEMGGGNPSITQQNAENARLTTKYALTGINTVTVGPSTAVAPSAPISASNVFTNYIVNSPFPTATDPTDNTVKPVGWPSSDTANLTNKLSLVFGSNNASTMSPNCSACVITNRAQLDSHVEHNQLDGSAGTDANSDPAKYSNPGAFNAFFRAYPAGDPHDTTVMDPDALTFHAYCSGNNGTSCQGAGNIVTGIIRPETAIYPGDLVEVCYKSASGPASWSTNWLLMGQYPAAGTTPNFYAPGGFPYSTENYNETDDPDGFAIQDGVSPVHDLTQGVTELNNSGDDAIQGSPFSTPRAVFLANSGPFSLNGNFSNFGSNSQYSTYAYDRSAAMHCYQTELVPAVYSNPGADTSNATVTTNGHVINSIDGLEYSDMIDNWNGGTTLSWDGVALPNVPPAAAIMVALQYGTTFRTNAYNAMTPSGVAADTEKVYSIRVWHRNHGSPPAPTLNNGITPPTGSTVGYYFANNTSGGSSGGTTSFTDATGSNWSAASGVTLH